MSKNTKEVYFKVDDVIKIAEKAALELDQLLKTRKAAEDRKESTGTGGGTSAQRKRRVRTFATNHFEVFPPAPVPGFPVIPSGGLARCICTPGCTRELPQPAYRNLTHEETLRFFPKESLLADFSGVEMMDPCNKHR